MGYYPDKSQIPQGFEEWTFSNTPEDGEIVDVLKYGKIEAMRFNKQYMAFNPKFDHPRLGGWMLGVVCQEGITHFKRRRENQLKKESKTMCLRDKTKVCDLCHECDVYMLNPS